ncbi:MAG TPA: hypothetical protein VE397_19885 [Stellaceae bacterium]|nr:hypothetical protein [Stellaceae bacterium]
MRQQICTDAVAASLGDNRDVGDIKCVAMRLQQEEADDGVVCFGDPNLACSKAFCGKHGGSSGKLEAWESGVASARRLVDRLKARDLVGPTRANEPCALYPT